MFFRYILRRVNGNIVDRSLVVRQMSLRAEDGVWKNRFTVFKRRYVFRRNDVSVASNTHKNC